MNPAIIQAAAAERTRDMHARATARQRAAQFRRIRRAQHSRSAQSRGFRVRHVLRAA